MITPIHTLEPIAGGILLASGTCLAAAGTLKLGRNLTPFICPKANAVLLDKGAYGIVRHPIYAGLLQMAFGWGLWVSGWLTLGYAIILFMIFDRKSRREEEFLLGFRDFRVEIPRKGKVRRCLRQDRSCRPLCRQQ